MIKKRDESVRNERSDCGVCLRKRLGMHFKNEKWGGDRVGCDCCRFSYRRRGGLRGVVKRVFNAFVTVATVQRAVRGRVYCSYIQR